jgi:hypothetical protein
VKCVSDPNLEPDHLRLWYGLFQAFDRSGRNSAVAFFRSFVSLEAKWLESMIKRKKLAPSDKIFMVYTCLQTVYINNRSPIIKHPQFLSLVEAIYTTITTGTINHEPRAGPIWGWDVFNDISHYYC